MKIIIFSIVFLSIFVLLNIYISKRLIKKLDLNVKIKKYINIFLIINFVGTIGYMFARYTDNTPSWLYFLLSLPIGVVFLLFYTAIIYDISRVVLFKIPISNSRRDFFKKSLDISSLLMATALTTRAIYEARSVKLEKIDINIKNLKKSYKIVQLSDIHIGGLIDGKFIKDIVKRVNNLKPDLVVITGDLVDIKISKARPILKELKELSSVYGTYFIVGNHEYFHNIEDILQEVKSLNIRVLENENIYIGEKDKGFNLAGVYDLMGYRVGQYEPNLQKALADKKDSPTILLAHQPKFAEEVDGGVDLMLSGHTHGGQLYPFKLLVRLQQGFVAGLYNKDEDFQIYVNKGTGFWGPPMRLGATSEITEINLQPK